MNFFHSEAYDWIRMIAPAQFALLLIWGTCMAIKHSVIPYWRENSKFSQVMLSRLAVRLAWIILAVTATTLIFGVLFPPLIDQQITRGLQTLVWFGGSITYIWYWKSNPLGPRGL